MMHLFPTKKSRVIPTLAQSVPPPRQNVYSAYNRLAPSPPPPPFIEDNGRSYNKNIMEKYSRDNDDVEKYNHKTFFIQEAEKNGKLNKVSYSKALCCFCFPCLPMWTRTICCFLLLGIVGMIGLIAFFVLSFQKPQIVFVGNISGNQLSAPLVPEGLQFEYSVYNGNFFEFNFDSIKAVIYYPTPNKTTVGVGEISNLVLGPQTVTNITFPVKLMTSNMDSKQYESSADGLSNSTTAVGDDATSFMKMVASSCNSTTEEDGESSRDPYRHHHHKEIVVMFDLMPTIKIYDYPLVTLAFTGQKTVMSCDKLSSFIEKESEKKKNKKEDA